MHLGRFQAVFSAISASASSELVYPYGMAFKGTVTVSEPHHVWHVPAPASTKLDVIDQPCLIRFAHEGHPAVLSEGYSGGAHCCELPVLDSHSLSTRYVKVLDLSNLNTKSPVKFDPNEGFVPKAVENQVLLETQDGAFAYRFGCYACTPMPIRLDGFNERRLVDVTSQYSTLVRAEVAKLWSEVKSAIKTETVSPDGGAFGPIAAWVADQCTLHHGQSAWASVLAFRREGKLSDAAYHLAAFTTRSFVPDH